MQACEKERFYKTMESLVKSYVGHAPVSIGIERLELKERIENSCKALLMRYTQLITKCDHLYKSRSYGSLQD